MVMVMMVHKKDDLMMAVMTMTMMMMMAVMMMIMMAVVGWIYGLGWMEGVAKAVIRTREQKAEAPDKKVAGAGFSFS